MYFHQLLYVSSSYFKKKIGILYNQIDFFLKIVPVKNLNECLTDIIPVKSIVSLRKSRINK